MIRTEDVKASSCLKSRSRPESFRSRIKMADVVDPSSAGSLTYESSVPVQVFCAFGDEVVPVQIQNECRPNGEKEGIEQDDTTTQIRWNTNMVKLLIQMYQDHRDKFMSMQYSNKKVWQMIAEKLKAHGYVVTGEQCDIKWKNLKKRYRRTKEKYDINFHNHWTFFADMDAILSPNLECQPVIIASSIRGSDINSNEAESRPSVCQSRKPIHWNGKVVNLLLSAYSFHQEKFHSTQYSINKVWQLIAFEMKKNGYSLTGEQCNAKWRSMKKCYMQIKLKRISRHKIKWPFFHEVDRIMSKNPESNRTKLKASSSFNTGIITCVRSSQIESSTGTCNGTNNSPLDTDSETSSNERPRLTRDIPEVEPNWFAHFKAEKRQQHEELMEQRRLEENNRQTFRKNLLKLLTEVANKSRESVPEQTDQNRVNLEKRTCYEERLQQKRTEQENKQAFRETLLKLLNDVIHKH